MSNRNYDFDTVMEFKMGEFQPGTVTYFKKIMASPTFLFSIIDRSGRIKFVNRAFEIVSGYSSSELQGESFEEIFSLSGIRKIQMHEILYGRNSVYGQELSIVTKTGGSRYILIDLLKIGDDSGIPIELILIGKDITDKKNLELEIENLCAKIKISLKNFDMKLNNGNINYLKNYYYNDVKQSPQERLEEILNKLFKLNNDVQSYISCKESCMSIISHDLKNPLQALLLYSEHLIESSSQLDIDYINNIHKHIYNASAVMSNLLDNLFQWAKTQGSGFNCNPAEIELRSMIEKSIELHNIMANNKKITLVNKIRDCIHAFADKNMINTVLRNLISNAIKYSPEYGIVEITAEELEDTVEISVIDTGKGFNEEEIDKILNNHLYNGNSVTSGLGLSLCREFVALNGGCIKAISKKGEGSIFNFSLPKKLSQNG